MAIIQNPDLTPFYIAAQRFVDEALRRDGSLFAPGRSAWSPATIDDLYQR
ncbi:MAG: hypothetical protein RLZZ387_3005, partial [Chloroflexota bacterium]